MRSAVLISAVAWCCTVVTSDVINLLSNDYEDVVNNRQNDENDSPNYDLLPGDYPRFKQIPKTAFSCVGKLNWHYYADVEAGCQAFHMCETQYSKISFLCPIGSVFNQLHLVCDWWYNVDCSESLYFYPLREGISDDILRISADSVDLNLASSGGNADPKDDASQKNKGGERQQNNNRGSNKENRRHNVNSKN